MKAFLEAVRVIFSREELGAADPPPSTEGGATFFRWLFGRERLPPPAVSIPPRRTTFLQWLLVPEKLPEAPKAGVPARPSLLKHLVSRESLAVDPPPEKPKRPRRGRKRH